jgi:hypothetical protein
VLRKAEQLWTLQPNAMSPPPPPTPFPWFDVAIIAVLIALNGVFAMSELAIVSAREARLKGMVKAGSRARRSPSISPRTRAASCPPCRSASR